MDKLLVNLDFDGVLIPNDFEKKLFHNGEMIMNIDDYTKMVLDSPIPPLNFDLLKLFANNMDKYVLRLWTNRNLDLQKNTVKNLGIFKNIFDSFHFHGGEKKHSKVEGVVIDNNPKYLSCGEVDGILYEFK